MKDQSKARKREIDEITAAVIAGHHKLAWLFEFADRGRRKPWPREFRGVIKELRKAGALPARTSAERPLRSASKQRKDGRTNAKG